MEEYKLVVLGGGAVGKSCLTMQFLQHHFIHEYDPTIEDAYRKQVSVDDRVCLLDILDTAGQEEYSAMRDQYMRTGHGFILVYSITDRISFEEVQKLHDAIYRVQDKPTSEKIDIILIGNKCDLESDREVTTTEGMELAKCWNAPFLEASAKSRINVDETFFEIVRLIRKRGENPDPSKKKKGKSSPAKKIAKILGKNHEQCSIL